MAWKTPATLTFGVALALAACTAKPDPASEGATASAAPAAAPAAASPARPDNPTSEDISNYPLDMDKMRKLATTMSLTADAEKRGERFNAKASNDETAGQTIARLEGDAKLRAILGKVGWSARDYVWTTAAMLQASMLDATLAADPSAIVPPGHSRRNIDFVREHKAEIEKMTAGMSAIE